VVLEAGCVVVDSIIEGPTVIGERTRIERARIGPGTSIGPDCRVVASTVSASVVMEDSTIEGVARPITGSLIGRNVDLRGDAGAGYQMVLGDFSRARVP
jgi:glucose-1-phosphate thymidylyltransferase